MKLKIGENEYSIKFGYKPTLKERIISKVVKMSNITEANKDTNEVNEETNEANEETNIEKIEDLLLFLPELLLVGLQVHHEDFRYDYDTKEGKEEQLNKAFALVEEYMNDEKADVMVFFMQLQEALLKDSFLKGLFQKEQKKQEVTKAGANLTLVKAETQKN